LAEIPALIGRSTWRKTTLESRDSKRPAIRAGLFLLAVHMFYRRAGVDIDDVESRFDRRLALSGGGYGGFACAAHIKMHTRAKEEHLAGVRIGALV
jgi:hypothetical protein